MITQNFERTHKAWRLKYICWRRMKHIHSEMCRCYRDGRTEVIDGSNVIPNKTVHKKKKKKSSIAVGLLSNINLHVISITTIAETTTDDLTKWMRVDYEKERPNAGRHLEWGLCWRICVSGEKINCLSARQEVNQEREEPDIQIAEIWEKSMLWQTICQNLYSDQDK